MSSPSVSLGVEIVWFCKRLSSVHSIVCLVMDRRYLVTLESDSVRVRLILCRAADFICCIIALTWDAIAH